MYRGHARAAAKCGMLGAHIGMAQEGDMKPPLFDYYDPSTEAETLALLAAYGPDAKILAGRSESHATAQHAPRRANHTH